jgi:hypothetical protein
MTTQCLETEEFRGMVSILRVVFAVMAMVVAGAVAAPAEADRGQYDQGEYLSMLLPKYTYLNSQQLIREGAIVCAITHSGRPSSDAVLVVQKDLGAQGVPGVSLSVAGEIVAGANVYLGC